MVVLVRNENAIFLRRLRFDDNRCLVYVETTTYARMIMMKGGANYGNLNALCRCLRRVRVWYIERCSSASILMIEGVLYTFQS